MTTTKAARMTNLLESCQGFADFTKLVREAVQAQFPEDEPAELAALLETLLAAEKASQVLDDATA